MSCAEYWRDWEGRREGVTEHSKRKKKQGKKPIEAEEVEGIRPHERDIMV